MNKSIHHCGIWNVCRWLAMTVALTSCGAGPTVDEVDANVIAANNRGVALMGRYDFEAARQVFAGLVETNPGNADLRVNLAIAILNRQQEGDETSAKALLDAVLAGDPGHLRARYTRGLLELSVGASEAAYVDFLQVTEADPRDPAAAYHVGQCLMQLEKFDEAVSWFERAVAGDPYLRSAYYRGFQALQRLGRAAEAGVFLERFQALEGNPRARLMEFKYTRMGSRAEAAVLGRVSETSAPAPSGPVFGDPSPLVAAATGWRRAVPERPPNTTACDLDDDGGLDLFVAGVASAAGDDSNLVLMASGGSLAVAAGHPLARVPGVNTALWGDIDSNGLNDAYLCRSGPNQLWLQTGPGEWVDVTDETGVAGGDLDTVDGALFDADHDGDLDVFVVNADGDNELFNNNRDGSFRALAAERGLTGDGRASRSVVVADLDGDLDADLVVVNDRPPHQVFANRLLWKYEPAEGWDRFVMAQIEAAVAGDVDADGKVELYTTVAAGGVHRWLSDGFESFPAEAVPAEAVADDANESNAAGRRLDLTDVDGDGVLDLLVSDTGGWRLHSAVDGRVIAADDRALTSAGLYLLDPLKGPSLVGWSPSQGPIVWEPGPGRHAFVALTLSGMEDDANSMRTNASGIGTRVAARVGSRWTVVDACRPHSGPGQSLQPVSVGLGGAPAVDFVAIDWSDGVFQTEMNLGPGEVHAIVETQRQMSSCPVLFVWNGENYAFVTDILGVGGIGYAVGPGEYSQPRPWENLMLPAGTVQPRDGRILVKLTEPMEEAAYLDAVRLVTYDLPPGWSMSVDDRMAISGPRPTGRPVFYRTSLEPTRAFNERGDDVTFAVAAADRLAAPVGEIDRRFIGRLEEEHILTLEFDEAINWLGRRLALVADGWVEYPYSSTSFAAWQAGAAYLAPTLEARGADGSWTVVLDQFGYPAGMPRQISVPLPRLPSGTTALRIRSNQEIYWDRVIVVSTEVTGKIIRRNLPLAAARVEQVGFARRTTGPERLPHYDHARRAPLWDSRVQPGFYTRFGDALPLVAAADDALAIIGPGEGVHLEFSAPADGPPPGWSRVYVVEAEGWCKDMDLYTENGSTLEPLPAAKRASSTTAMLRATHNTRWMGY